MKRNAITPQRPPPSCRTLAPIKRNCHRQLTSVADWLADKSLQQRKFPNNRIK